jgi:hypothetical protein
MEEALDPVVLNIYELSAPEQGSAGSSEVPAAASWLQKLLTPVGFITRPSMFTATHTRTVQAVASKKHKSLTNTFMFLPMVSLRRV